MNNPAGIINAVLDWLRSKQSTTIDKPIPISVYDDKPTQKDKPSPSSTINYHSLHRRLLRNWHEDKYFITGVANTNSMEPFIDDNSLIVYEKIKDPSSFPFSVGMVCLYDGDGGQIPTFKGHQVLHRVIAIRGDELKFKGDNNFLPDGWIKQEHVIGNVVAVNYAEKRRPND